MTGHRARAGRERARARKLAQLPEAVRAAVLRVVRMHADHRVHVRAALRDFHREAVSLDRRNRADRHDRADLGLGGAATDQREGRLERVHVPDRPAALEEADVEVGHPGRPHLPLLDQADDDQRRPRPRLVAGRDEAIQRLEWGDPVLVVFAVARFAAGAGEDFLDHG